MVGPISSFGVQQNVNCTYGGIYTAEKISTLGTITTNRHHNEVDKHMHPDGIDIPPPRISGCKTAAAEADARVAPDCSGNHIHSAACMHACVYSHLSKVLVIHFLAGMTTTILITKIAVTQQQQRLCNKE